MHVRRKREDGRYCVESCLRAEGGRRLVLLATVTAVVHTSLSERKREGGQDGHLVRSNAYYIP